MLDKPQCWGTNGHKDWEAERPMSKVPKRLATARKRNLAAEQRVAVQRARVQHWMAKGNHEQAAKALALLKLVEKGLANTRAVRTTLEAFDLQLKLGAKASPTTSTPPAAPEAAWLECPRCGLAVLLLNENEGYTLKYDLVDWSQRCANKHFGSPAFCELPHGHRRCETRRAPSTSASNFDHMTLGCWRW